MNDSPFAHTTGHTGNWTCAEACRACQKQRGSLEASTQLCGGPVPATPHFSRQGRLHPASGSGTHAQAGAQKNTHGNKQPPTNIKSTATKAFLKKGMLPVPPYHKKSHCAHDAMSSQLACHCNPTAPRGKSYLPLSSPHPPRLGTGDPA